MNKYSQQFVGTWKLLTCTIENPDGTSKHPFGKNPIGYIMYNPDGYMAVNIMQVNRPKFNSEDWLASNSSDKEKAQAFDSFVAYCGKYEIDAEKNKITHYPEAISLPNQLNVPQVRFFEFNEDTLTLSSVDTVDGIEYPASLVWQKLSQA